MSGWSSVASYAEDPASWSACLRTGGRAERLAYCGGQSAAVRPVSIDVGVVDRYLQACCTARAHCDAERRDHLIPGEAVRPRIIHRLHDRLVEDIGVEVNPEPVLRAPFTRQVPHSLAGCCAGTETAESINQGI